MWHDQPLATMPSLPWHILPQIVAQNKPFLPKIVFLVYFCHNNEKIIYQNFPVEEQLTFQRWFHIKPVAVWAQGSLCFFPPDVAPDYVSFLGLLWTYLGVYKGLSGLADINLNLQNHNDLSSHLQGDANIKRRGVSAAMRRQRKWACYCWWECKCIVIMKKPHGYFSKS